MNSGTSSDSGEVQSPEGARWSPREIELRLERLQEETERIRSQVDRVAGFFEGPNGVWVRLQGIEEAQKDIRELKDELGKLNSTRNKVIGGCLAVSATTALLIAILRLVPADPPVIQNILPPSSSLQQTPGAAAPSVPPKSTS